MSSRKNVIQAALVATVLTEVIHPIPQPGADGWGKCFSQFDSILPPPTSPRLPLDGFVTLICFQVTAVTIAGRGRGTEEDASRQGDGPAGGHALPGCGGACGESARAGTRPGRQSGRKELLAPGAHAEQIWVCLCVEAPPPQSRSF